MSDSREQTSWLKRDMSSLMVRNPRMVVALTLAYVGIGLVVIPLLDIELTRFVQRYGLPAIGAVVLTSALNIAVAERQRIKGSAERQFIDVDDRSSERVTLQATLDAIRTELRALKELPDVDEERVAQLVKSLTPAATDLSKTTFVSYYIDLKNVLQEKAANADAKASLLLDRGVAYSRLGIAFFVASIVVWQVLAWNNGFQAQFIYGIVSCSLLFLTIEFLSAWFLRQYVQFVETSTYLMKVKSIFDRYLLTYLVALDERVHALDDKAAAGGVLNILKDDIKWPDTYRLKDGEVSFAREMIDSLATLAKAMNAAAKGEKGKDAA